MILIVGDKPSKRTHPNIPFKGAACEKRLYTWIKTITDKTPRFINRVSPFFETAVYMALHAGMPIVALGTAASNALKRDKIPHFKLPHPSGRNRLLNNKDYINMVLLECRSWLGE